MRTTEQLSEEDAGEPPSLERVKTYQDVLFEAHNKLKMFPPYPEYTNATGEFKVSLFDDYDNIEIEAVLQGNLADKYRRLDNDNQYFLANRIEQAMGGLAVSLFGNETEQYCQKDTVILINNLPLIFEPINHAVLVGKWEDWEKRKMIISSQCIEDHNQQRLLLGGLAAFVTYLEQPEQQ